MDRPLFHICEWPASLYNEKTRKWTYGMLAVLPEDIFFTDTDKPEIELLKIPYEGLVEVKKTTTGLVFGAICLVTKENKKIWFSSLPDRESVYGALKHFWQAKLFQTSKEKKIESKGRKTVLGQRLLEIVQDSENTLAKAAVQLQNQGQQIDNAIENMSDLHGDLDVADNLLEGIESWFGKWRLPEQYQYVDPVFVNKSDIPEIFEYEVLYTKLETSQVNVRQVGTLRVSKDGLTILNMKMRTEHYFRWSDVSQIRVVTPWEVMVSKFSIGKADLVYCLVSAHMMAVLKLLDQCARYKLKYDQPPEKELCVKHKHSDERAEILGENRRKAVPADSTTDDTVVSSQVPSGVGQLQVSQTAQVVSDKEADEFSQGIERLRALAVSLNEEITAQNEKLGCLTVSVDSANQRLDETQGRVNKMLN